MTLVLIGAAVAAGAAGMAVAWRFVDASMQPPEALTRRAAKSSRSGRGKRRRELTGNNEETVRQ